MVEPNCPRCKGKDFLMLRDDYDLYIKENDSEIPILFIWVYCENCGCIVGCFPQPWQHDFYNKKQ